MRPTIKLTPWSRVEGTFRIGSKPAANVPITINIQGSDEYGANVPHIFTFHDVTSGPNGRFVFERVFPGRGWIGRRIMLTVNDGAADVTSSCMMRAEFPAGETTHHDAGGIGRAVVGQLRPPETYDGRVPWNFALVNLQFDQTSARLGAIMLPPVPGLEERVMANLAEMQSITATVDRDGHFRIDDVPAGVYLLDASFQSQDRTLARYALPHRRPAGRRKVVRQADRSRHFAVEVTARRGFHADWLRRGSNPHGGYPPQDFKSCASASSATQPDGREVVKV